MKHNRLLLLIWLFACLGACQKQNKQALRVFVLSYEDFGPKYLAYTLLGNEWYQWEESEDENKSYRIQVVVYKDEDLERVKKAYPVQAEAEQDYRYVSYEAAMEYLNRHSQNPALSESSRQKLEETKLRLMEAFGETPE
ncbi:MAG: hypothetical protein KatS3mg033_0831 [Thermonema sp.]|uniref:hypothetical protein n=1 Tax=Thermonema TaxID=28194 RepID=UPI00056DF091|nr:MULTISPECIES: hypothetical protein [Thermonema]GIV39031.1 MAG: hypothetical protein KatS3mg033_0831 [Thermonema sp.]